MGLLAKLYSPVICIGKLLRSPLLLAIRLYWGIMFVKAGYGKLLDIPKVAEFFTDLGIPFPSINAYAAAGVEFFGGILLVLGLLSRLVSIPLAFTMIVAYATAHYDGLISAIYDPSIFVAQGPFNFLLASLLVLAFGPGKFSLDYLLGIECNKSKCHS
jgi:putative oxidoreductase